MHCQASLQDLVICNRAVPDRCKSKQCTMLHALHKVKSTFATLFLTRQHLQCCTHEVHLCWLLTCTA
jgi:hypothetical protein